MRHLVIEGIAVVLFVLSTAFLFSDRVRASHALFVIIGILTLASSYVITKTILDGTFDRRTHHYHEMANAPAAGQVAAAAPAVGATPAEASILDAVLQQVYAVTEGTLNRIARAGTGQQAISVSSDTVVDVIFGLAITLLGIVAQLLSSLTKRVLGGA
jgi:hypothetical protein